MAAVGKASTAKAVAQKAGVSRSAVSRAFNPVAYLDPKKRAHILAVAKEIGYHPNMAARAMVSNRSHLVAVILPELRQPWESQELDALTDALQALGFATLVYKIPFAVPEFDQLSHLRAYNPDSIIVYSDSLPLGGVKALFSGTRPIFPVYSDGTKVLAIETAESDPGFDQLIIDQRPGIKHALRLLSACGCRSLAWLTGTEDTHSNQDRQRVILEHAAQYGLEITGTIRGDFSYERAREEVRSRFRAGLRVDALFAANDVSAFGALDALRHDLGLSVPQDVKVIGFDNINQSSWKSYDLTTVGLDIDERVRALTRLIRDRLEDRQAPTLFERVESRLIVRGTVA